jgi:hypothetical protein
MISDIKFGKATKPKFMTKATAFYVYHNLSGVALINSNHDDWLGITVDIAAILSHETLHKVIFKLEGGKTSSALDKWCKSRKWLYNDDTGICLFAWECLLD